MCRPPLRAATRRARPWYGLALTVVAAAAAAEAPALRVCLLADNPPYSVRERAGGFDLEVATAVAGALARPFAPVWVANARRIQELEESDLPTAQLARGGCDAVFSVPGPASDSLRGTSGLALGAPYYGAAFELVSCAPGQALTLAGRKLAIQAATIAHFAALRLRAEPVTYFSPEAALAGLAAGEAELALLWGPAVGALLAAAPVRPDASPACTLAADYQAPAALRWNEHVATRAAESDLRTAIDRALAVLRADGTLERIARSHGVPVHPPFADTYSAAALKALGTASDR